MRLKREKIRVVNEGEKKNKDEEKKKRCIESGTGTRMSGKEEWMRKKRKDR
jgi:hypothetical protein